MLICCVVEDNVCNEGVNFQGLNVWQYSTLKSVKQTLQITFLHDIDQIHIGIICSYSNSNNPVT